MWGFNFKLEKGCFEIIVVYNGTKCGAKGEPSFTNEFTVITDKIDAISKNSVENLIDHNIERELRYKEHEFETLDEYMSSLSTDFGFHFNMDDIFKIKGVI